MKKILSVLIVAVMLLSLCYIPAYAATGENLALNKPVHASSEYGGAYIATAVNDGKMSTSWSEGSVRLQPKDEEGNDWIQIDLGSRYDITSMIAYSRSDVNSASERMNWIYQVSETADFAEKTVIGIKKSAGTAGSGYEAKPIEPATGRYVRVACDQYFVIAEIEVYGTPAAVVTKGEYDDVAQEGELYNASQLAYNLGIMEGIGGGDFGVNHLMTRAEAAQVVALLGNSGELKATDTGFTDVKSDNKLSGYIAWCENSMILSKGGEFRPDDFVTGTEFATMLLRLNGWWEAMAQGQYPDIVEPLAKKAKITDGVDIVLENDLNRGQALLMMKNVLTNEKIKTIGVDTEEGVIYEKTRDEFYLYDVFGYELLDGIVDSHVLSDLVEPKDGADNAVTVDGKQYLDLSGKMNAFLGERVWYLLDPAKNEIVGAWRNPDIGFSLTVQCDQIQSSDEGSVEYWEEGKDKIQKIRLEDPVYFIKNGIASGDYTAENLKRTNGKVVFIDNDRNNRYDVIKLYEPQVMLFEYISDDGGKLVVGGKGVVTDAEGNVTMESKNFVYENYGLLSAYLNGFAVDHKEISGEMLIYIYASDDGRYVELELSNKTVEGKIEKILGDIFVINGVEYERSQYYIENKDMMDKIKVGADCAFLVDINGKIVWAKNNSITISPETLGAVYAMANPEGFGNYKFKLFNQSNEHVVLTAANKVIIDGKECGRAEIKEMGSDYFMGKAVIYKLNSEGKIRYMDTENYDPINEPDSWLIKQDKWSLPSGSLRNAIGFYTSDGKSMVMPFFDDFKVFTLPRDAATGTLITSEKLLSKYSYSDMSSMVAVNSDSGVTGTYTFYGLEDDESPRVAVRILDTSTTLNVKPVSAYTSNSVLVVESVGTYMDGDTLSYFIRGYIGASGIRTDLKLPSDIDRVLDSHIIYTNKATSVENTGIGFTGLNYVSTTTSTDLIGNSSPVEDLKLGDVLRYEESNGVVTALERIYATEEGSPSLTYEGAFINTGDNWHSAHRAGFRALSAPVAKLENGILAIGSETFKYASSNATTFILIQDGEVITESIKLLPNYVQKNDRMLMISLSGKVSYLIAYK